MPDHEFELYLSLLSRFLRLKPAQREAIADELRDHLELRVEELAARGLARDAAIRAALDELGDAAGLASRFTHVARKQKRRRIMRYTVGSMAALAAAFLIAAGFWPKAPHVDMTRLAVAGSDEGQAGAEAAAARVGELSSTRDEVETKLARSIGEAIDFNELPLGDALEYISNTADVDVLLDRRALTNAGVGPDTPVNLHIRHTPVSAKTALELVLEPLELGYVVRDGLVFVTIAQEANEIQVYNVRDLLQGQTTLAGVAAGGVPTKAGPEQVVLVETTSRILTFDRNVRGAQVVDPAIVKIAPLGANKLQFHAKAPGATQVHVQLDPEHDRTIDVVVLSESQGFIANGTQPTSSLADVVCATIEPTSWAEVGGNGSIVEFNGLLVVKNTRSVHQRLRQLLEMMRSSIEGAGQR